MLFFPSLAPLGTAVEMSLLSAALYLTLLGIDCVTSARQLHFSVTVFAVTLSVRGEGVQTQLPLCLQTIYMCNYGSVLVITCLWSITHPVISFLPQASETHTWRHTHTYCSNVALTWKQPCCWNSDVNHCLKCIQVYCFHRDIWIGPSI